MKTISHMLQCQCTDLCWTTDECKKSWNLVGSCHTVLSKDM